MCDSAVLNTDALTILFIIKVQILACMCLYWTDLSIIYCVLISDMMRCTSYNSKYNISKLTIISEFYLSLLLTNFTNGFNDVGFLMPVPYRMMSVTTYMYLLCLNHLWSLWRCLRVRMISTKIGLGSQIVKHFKNPHLPSLSYKQKWKQLCYGIVMICFNLFVGDKDSSLRIIKTLHINALGKLPWEFMDNGQ